MKIYLQKKKTFKIIFDKVINSKKHKIEKFRFRFFFFVFDIYAIQTDLFKLKNDPRLKTGTLTKITAGNNFNFNPKTFIRTSNSQENNVITKKVARRYFKKNCTNTNSMNSLEKKHLDHTDNKDKNRRLQM